MRAITTFSSLYLATLFMLFANGLLTTYLALDLERQGAASWAISGLTSAYYFGLVIGAKMGHKLIARVGHIRSYVAASGVTAATVLMMGLIEEIPFWIGARFITGLVMMCQYMVIESWLNDQAEPQQRGIVFGLYIAASSLGGLLGQLVFSMIDPIDFRVLMIVSIFFSLCLIPLAVTRAIHPTHLKAAPLNIFYFVKRLPQVLIITLVAGMFVGSFYGLGPVFASRLGLNSQDAGLYMAVSIGASLVIQWPLGLLSDRVNRLLLITGVAILLVIASFLINLPWLSVWQILFISYFAVALQFTLYPLSVAIANDNIDEDKRVSLSAVLLVLFGVGAVIGPQVSGLFMQYWGATGLYKFVLLISSLVIAMNLLKASRRLAADTEDALPHVMMPDGQLSPIAAATLDPRIDEDAFKEEMEDEEASEIRMALREEIEAAELEKQKSKVERYAILPYENGYSYQRFLYKYGRPETSEHS